VLLNDVPVTIGNNIATEALPDSNDSMNGEGNNTSLSRITNELFIYEAPAVEDNNNSQPSQDLSAEGATKTAALATAASPSITEFSQSVINDSTGNNNTSHGTCSCGHTAV